MTTLRWEFVPLSPTPLRHDERGLAVDVAVPASAPDVPTFTHHGTTRPQAGAGTSSARLLLASAETVGSWRDEVRTVRVSCHVQPDADCYVSSYVAWVILAEAGEGAPRLSDPAAVRFLEQLVDFVTRVDSGELRPADVRPAGNAFNLYTLYLFVDTYLKRWRYWAEDSPVHLRDLHARTAQLLPGCRFDFRDSQQASMAVAMLLTELVYQAFRAGVEGSDLWLRAGGDVATDLMPFVAAALEARRERARSNPEGECGWLKPGWDWVVELLEHFAKDVRSMVRSAGAIVGALTEDSFFTVMLPSGAVPAALVVAPSAVGGVAAKLLRDLPSPRNSGEKIKVTAIVFDDEPGHAIISTGPKEAGSLRGLGLALQRANEKKLGPRPPCPRYWRRASGGALLPDPLFASADPWYDGRDFAYTIVDAPRAPRNRRLTVEEIRKVLSADWQALGAAYETAEYREWLEGEPSAPPGIAEGGWSDESYTWHRAYPLLQAWPLGLHVYLALVAANQADGRIADGVRDLLASPLQSADAMFPRPAEGRAGASGRRRTMESRLEVLRKALQRVRGHAERFEDALSMVNPPGTTLLHQLGWLEAVMSPKETGGADIGDLLEEEVRRGLRRLLAARLWDDPGEAGGASGEVHGDFASVRIAQLLDHLLEEVEDVCRNVGRVAGGTLQRKVDEAQRLLDRALREFETLPDSARATVGPLLANIHALLESFDEVLHRFVSDPDASVATALTLIALDRRIHSEGDTAILERVLAQGLTILELTSSPDGGGMRFEKRIRTKIRDLFDADPNVVRGSKSCDSQLLFRRLGPWLVLGPELLGGLVLSAARSAIEKGHCSWAADVLSLAGPPRRSGRLERAERLAAAGLRQLPRWFVWGTIIGLGGWLSAGKPGSWPTVGAAGVLLLAAFAAPALVLVTRVGLHAGVGAEGAAAWRRGWNAAHRAFTLPAFLFQAAVGVFLAVVTELGDSIWKKMLDGSRSEAWVSLGALGVLCFLGAYVRSRGIPERSLSQTLVTLGHCIALVHLVALPAAVLVGAHLAATTDVRTVLEKIGFGGWLEFPPLMLPYLVLVGTLVGFAAEVLSGTGRSPWSAEDSH